MKNYTDYRKEVMRYISDATIVSFSSYLESEECTELLMRHYEDDEDAKTASESLNDTIYEMEANTESPDSHEPEDDYWKANTAYLERDSDNGADY